MPALKRKFVIEVFDTAAILSVGWIYNIKKLKAHYSVGITHSIERATFWRYKKSAQKNKLKIEENDDFFKSRKNYFFKIVEITPLSDIRYHKLINLKRKNKQRKNKDI